MNFWHTNVQNNNRMTSNEKLLHRECNGASQYNQADRMYMDVENTK
jgi:hypothetical protein